MNELKQLNLMRIVRKSLRHALYSIDKYMQGFTPDDLQWLCGDWLSPDGKDNIRISKQGDKYLLIILHKRRFFRKIKSHIYDIEVDKAEGYKVSIKGSDKILSYHPLTDTIGLSSMGVYKRK